MNGELLRAFNYARGLRGVGNDLVVERASRNGYTELATIRSGWYVEYSQDNLTKEHILNIFIAEHDGWKTEDIKTCSDVVFKGRRYKTREAPKPAIHSPNIWVITANPTGEVTE